MNPANLYQFIRYALSRGIDEKHIEKMLSEHGWNSALVSRALLDVKFNTTKEEISEKEYEGFQKKRLPWGKITISLVLFLLLLVSVGYYVFPIDHASTGGTDTSKGALEDPGEKMQTEPAPEKMPKDSNAQNSQSAGGAAKNANSQAAVPRGWCQVGDSWSDPVTSGNLKVCGFVAIGEKNICHASTNCPLRGYYFTFGNTEIWEIKANGNQVQIK